MFARVATGSAVLRWSHVVVRTSFIPVHADAGDHRLPAAVVQSASFTASTLPQTSGPKAVAQRLFPRHRLWISPLKDPSVWEALELAPKVTANPSSGTCSTETFGQFEMYSFTITFVLISPFVVTVREPP